MATQVINSSDPQQYSGLQDLLDFQRLAEVKRTDDFTQQLQQQNQQLLAERQQTDDQEAKSRIALQAVQTQAFTDQDKREAALAPLMQDDWKQKLLAGNQALEQGPQEFKARMSALDAETQNTLANIKDRAAELVDRQKTSALANTLAEQQIKNAGFEGKTAEFQSQHLQQTFDQSLQEQAARTAATYAQIDQAKSAMAGQKHTQQMQDTEQFAQYLKSDIFDPARIEGIQKMYSDNPMISGFKNDPNSTLDPDLQFNKFMGEMAFGKDSTPEQRSAGMNYFSTRENPKGQGSILDNLPGNKSGKDATSTMADMWNQIQKRRDAANNPKGTPDPSTPIKNLLGNEVVPYSFSPTGQKDVDTLLNSVSKDTTFATMKVGEAQQLPGRQKGRLDDFITKQPYDHKVQLKGDTFDIPPEVANIPNKNGSMRGLVATRFDQQDLAVVTQNAIIDKGATVGQQMAFQTMYNKLVSSVDQPDLAKRIAQSFRTAINAKPDMLSPNQQKALATVDMNFDLTTGTNSGGK